MLVLFALNEILVYFPSLSVLIQQSCLVKTWRGFLLLEQNTWKREIYFNDVVNDKYFNNSRSLDFLGLSTIHVLVCCRQWSNFTLGMEQLW